LAFLNKLIPEKNVSSDMESNKITLFVAIGVPQKFFRIGTQRKKFLCKNILLILAGVLYAKKFQRWANFRNTFLYSSLRCFCVT
jgi:hypothetical protein